MKRAPLIFILCSFVALCVLYNFTFPLLEGIDEPSHYWYVNQVANTKNLPDLSHYTGDPLTYERHQMPLYYVLAAVFIAPIDRSGFSDYVVFNVGGAPPNMLVHNEDETTWPPAGTVLAVRVVRGFSTLLGLMTLIFIYSAITALGFGRAIALVGTATLAYNPRFILLSSSVTNDIALACSTAGVLAILAAGVAARKAGRSFSTARVVALGITSGIAFLTKLNAVVVLVPIGITMLWSARAKGSPGAHPQSRLQVSQLVRWSLGFLLGFAVITGPYFVYCAITYGNPMAIAQRGVILSPYERPEPLTLRNAPFVVQRLVQTWWDYFGAGGLVTPFQYVGYALAGLSCLGIVAALLRGRLPVRGLRSIAFLMPASLFGAMCVAFVPWLLLYQGSIYARFFAPAFLSIQLFVGIGLTALFGGLLKQRAALVGGWVALLAGAVSAALVMLLFIMPAYSTVTYLSPARVRALPAAGRVTYDNGIQLVSALPDRVRLNEGETVNLHVLWQRIGERSAMQYLVVQVNDQQGNQLSRQVILPFGGHYNTNQWGPGVLQDAYPVTMPDVTQTKLVNILLGWYGYDAPHRVARVVPSGAESAIVATLKVRAAQNARPPDAIPTNTMHVTFNQSIALEGYDLRDGRLTLYWRSLQPVDRSYSVFIHLLDSSGKMVGQADGPVAYATQFWDADEQVLDQRSLPNLDGVAAIVLGLYDPQTGQRLNAQSATAPISDNAVTIWSRGP